ncbi:MAG: sigma-54-dependent Fis family transcriptional regulator [Deltaproteobacteria bacterium]|nr:sigma-54-dependent Fis family transcriptional regulator [Deltaproteobacteria bacterium]
MTVPRILVVDDKRDLADGVALVLADLSSEIRVAYSGEAALQAIENQLPDLIVSDIRMPGLDGVELLKRVRVRSPRTRVILLTAYGTIDSAVQAMKLGAFHYLTKPFDSDELVEIARRAIAALSAEDEIARLKAELADKTTFCDIVSRDRRMHGMFDTIRRVGPSSAAVLIRGESGTGKELVAKALHQVSPRADKRFVAFNAGAVPESLAEAELFGAKKGAYTGATQDRRGLFQAADGGTLFIDEVSSMSLGLQALLLRALQEHEVLPVGADRAVPVDVRVVSALNDDPQRLMREGRLRKDLYYRLAVVTINLPPLRERIEDIGLLATSFLERLAGPGRAPRRLSPQALRALVKHDWPGNVRELHNVIERAALLATGPEIEADDIVLEQQDGAAPPAEAMAPAPVVVTPRTPAAAAASAPAGQTPAELYDDAKKRVVEQFQREYVERLLAAHHHNITAAAAAAGITRAALHRILKRLEGKGEEGDEHA